MHYKKTTKIVSVFATSRLVSIFAEDTKCIDSREVTVNTKAFS